MSTNATVMFMEDNRPLCMLYKHYDGNAFGDELREFFRNMKVVNGLGLDTTNTANGIRCLAAQVIANFKDGAGDLYMASVDEDPDPCYHYVVTVKNGKAIVKRA